MKRLLNVVLVLICFSSCVRRQYLPNDSNYNSIAILNDSVWYGTGKINRIINPGNGVDDSKRIDLYIRTDIPYKGLSGGPNKPTNNGCVDSDCIVTQTLLIQNIPLKKGRYRLGELMKLTENSYPCRFEYIGNSGGVAKRYLDTGSKSNWIRINKIDKNTGFVDGQIAFTFKEDLTYSSRIHNDMPLYLEFKNCLFRIKMKDVFLKN